MSTLIVSAYTPTRENGRAIRTASIVQALLASGPVDLVYTQFGAPEPDQWFREQEGLTLHAVSGSRGVGRAFKYGTQRLLGIPPEYARGVTPELVKTAERFAETADRVIADGPIAGAALLSMMSRRPVIYNAQNVESSYRHTLQNTTRVGSPRLLKSFERGLLQAASESWMVSPKDIKDAEKLAPDAKLMLIPNCIDVEAIDPVRITRKSRMILFVGDFLYEPNVNGLKFLAEEVMPAIWPSNPEITLHVAGRKSDEIEVDQTDERVKRLGFVDDLDALYRQAGCVAVPLIEGGGSPLKFVEALAYGLPIVATPRAARGLAVVDGEHYFRAEPRKVEFAISLVEALTAFDSAKVGRNARLLAEAEYSLEALARRLAPK